MIEVRKTETFSDWMVRLRDRRARARIAARIDRLAFGNPGDVGPGYRVCFVKRGGVLIVLLCGGDKSTQPKDIKAAKMLAAALED